MGRGDSQARSCEAVAMARPIWSGAISFGLVSIPVKLYAATVDRSVRFHQIDRRTGSRVRQRRVSESDGSEVPYEEIVKGYETAAGTYVTVTPEELDALDPKASRAIDLLRFVDRAEIDPIFYDAAYLLGPDPGTPKPYRLLHRAMVDAGRVAIGRFVMRGRERLCALRARDDGVLVLNTMRYADEIRPLDEIDEFEALEGVELSDAEVAMAEQLIDTLAASFDPEEFHDEHREKVLELIARKGEGEEAPATAPAARSDDIVDLMAALEASVAEAKNRRVADDEAARSA